MAYERYIEKNGKSYGPYIQHNKKVDGKVITEYRGKSGSSVNGRAPYGRTPKHFSKKRLLGAKFFLLGLLGLIFIFSLIAFANFGLTGKVSLDIKSEYVEGESLEGNLKFSLKEGELIPLDSKIVLELGGNVQEYFLSELITLDAVDGFFYAEDTTLSGEGLGYGLIGSKKIYPDVNFDLEIFDIEDVGDGAGIGGDVGEIVPEVETPSEEIVDEPEVEEGFAGEVETEPSEESEEIIGEEVGGEEGVLESTETSEGAESSEGSPVTEESIETEAGGFSEGVSEKSKEKVAEKEEKSAEKEDKKSSENSESSESASESSSESSSDSSGGSILTGEVISESFVSGVVSKDNEFDYKYGEGKSAKIVEGSVMINGSAVDEDILKVNLKKDQVVVSTDYYYEEEGFGEDYVGEKKLKFTINLEEFDLVVEAPKGVPSVGGDVNTEGNSLWFSVKLVFENTILVEANKDLKISENDTLNETSEEVEEEKELIIDETIINETEIEVIVNETINFTGIELNINTTQYRAVLNRPVKWKKNIKLDEIKNISVELPKQANNITVYKIVEGSKEELAPEGVPPDMQDEILGGKELEQSEQVAEDVEQEQSEQESQDNATEPVVNEMENATELIIIQESGVEKIISVVEVQPVNESEVLTAKSLITAKVISGEVSVEIEGGFSFAGLFRKIFSAITGMVVYVEEEEESTEVFIEDNATEYDIDYETPAPVASEKNTSNGKRIVISSEVHYENILAYTVLPNEVPEGIIKMYWVTTENITSINNQTNETIVEFVAVRKPVDVVGHDLNNNSLVDYVEWVVPSLSNQTYELVIEISKAEHLDENRKFISDIYEVSIKDDVWSEVINDSEYVRVMFGQNLTSNRDITIYARGVGNESSSVEVYVKEGDVLIATFENISWEDWHKIYLTDMEGAFDVFDLRILGNVEFDYIVDPSEPSANRFKRKIIRDKYY